MKKYEQYYNKEGLSLEEETAVGNFLSELEIKTHFLPGGCKITMGLTEAVNEIFQEYASKHFGQLQSESYKDIHFFYSADTTDGRTLIIDPTGVQTGYSLDSITPYYGLADKAAGYSKRVFANRKKVPFINGKPQYYEFHP